MPISPRTRKPLVAWPTDKWEEGVAWAVGRQLCEDPEVGICTGESGLMVLDLDVKKGKNGVKAIILWLMDTEAMSREEAVAEITSPGVAVRTKSGGLQVYFKLPVLWPKELQKNIATAEGIDIRGLRGMVVAPPSRGYFFIKEEWDRLTVAPDWLREWRESKQAAKAVQKPDTTAEGPGGGVGMYETKNGRVGPPEALLNGQEKVVVWCPHHADKEGGSASAVIYDNSGWPRLYCSVCGTFPLWQPGRRERKPRRVRPVRGSRAVGKDFQKMTTDGGEPEVED